MSRVDSTNQTPGYAMPELADADKGKAEADLSARPDTPNNTRPKDKTQQRRKATVALQLASGRCSAKSSGLITPRQLSKDEHAWAGKLAKAPEADVGRLFHQSYDGVSDSFSGVLGKLSSKHAQTLFPDASRRKLLGKACVHALINRMASGIEHAFKAAESRIDSLIGSADKRASAWKDAKTPAQRQKLLVSLGVKPDRAKTLARQATAPDGELLAALKDSKQRVTQAKERVGYRMRLAVKTPSDALALLKTFGKHAQKARELTGIRKGSFADKALAQHVAAGKRDQKTFAVYQVAFGVLAGLVSGGVFSGAGVVGAGVVAAGTSAVMGAPGLVAQSGKREVAQLAEALKVADKGSHAKAKQAYTKALSGYIFGVVLGGAAGSASKLLGNAVKAGKLTADLARANLDKLLAHAPKSKLAAALIQAMQRTGVSKELATHLTKNALTTLADKGIGIGLDVLAAQLANQLAQHLSSKEKVR
jgi:hypothetical protein